MDILATVKLFNDRFMYNYQMICIAPMILITLMKILNLDVPSSNKLEMSLFNKVAFMFMGLMPFIYIVDCLVIATDFILTWQTNVCLSLFFIHHIFGIRSNNLTSHKCRRLLQS